MVRRVLRKIRKSFWLFVVPVWIIVRVSIRKWRVFGLDKNKNKNKVIIKIGHRGAMGYEPENTLASFQKALDLNVDAVEVDVHCCSTGEVVAIHDTTLERTTNGNGYVMKSDFEKLRSLNAGKGQKIPTLPEVLDLIDKKAVVNIELKGIGTAEPVSRIIREYIDHGWSKDMFWVSSFNHYELKIFKELEPEIKTGVILARIPRKHIDFTKGLKVDFVSPSMSFINKRFVDRVHREGMKIFPFTANHPEDIIRMKAIGVDGIFSNFPDRL